jgi:uncharacterized membrane protein YjgN (DUF898 family)
MSLAILMPIILCIEMPIFMPILLATQMPLCSCNTGYRDTSIKAYYTGYIDEFKIPIVLTTQTFVLMPVVLVIGAVMYDSGYTDFSNSPYNSFIPEYEISY